MSAVVARTWTRGDLAVATGDADFAQAGQVITVLAALPGDRATIKYVHPDGSGPSDLTVPTRYLVPLAPGARATDPATSHAAARDQRRRLGEPHRRILAALMNAGTHGLTDFELEKRTGRKQTSYGVRRGELVKAGLVTNTGTTRPSDTQSASTVWAVTPAGVDVWNALTPGQQNEARGGLVA
jgi:hypothetical protein